MYTTCMLCGFSPFTIFCAHLSKKNKRKGLALPNRCNLCKGEEETTNHLLLQCSKASMLCQLIFSLWCGLDYGLFN